MNLKTGAILEILLNRFPLYARTLLFTIENEIIKLIFLNNYIDRSLMSFTPVGILIQTLVLTYLAKFVLQFKNIYYFDF